LDNKVIIYNVFKFRISKKWREGDGIIIQRNALIILIYNLISKTTEINEH